MSDTIAPLRPAATILLLRDAPDGLEVWLMERARSVGFMASAWVFPGGRVDAGDADAPAVGGEHPDIPRAFWVAAARELWEEAGVRLGDGDAWDVRGMTPWAHWITPEVEPRAAHERAVAIERPRTGVAGETVILVGRAGRAIAEIAAHLFVGEHGHEPGVIARRGHPQVEARGGEHRRGHRAVSSAWIATPTRPPTSVPLIRMNWRSRPTAPSIRSVTVRASQRRTVSETRRTISPP